MHAAIACHIIKGIAAMKATEVLIVCLLMMGCVSNTSKELQSTQANIGVGKMICNYEKPIGSIVPRRVCRTRAEIEAEAAETKGT